MFTINCFCSIVIFLLFSFSTPIIQDRQQILLKLAQFYFNFNYLNIIISLKLVVQNLFNIESRQKVILFCHPTSIHSTEEAQPIQRNLAEPSEL